MDINHAKKLAETFLNKKENKDVFITYPDQAIYVNSPLEVIESHAERNKLKVIILKQNGVVIGDDHEVETTSVPVTLKTVSKKKASESIEND